MRLKDYQHLLATYMPLIRDYDIVYSGSVGILHDIRDFYEALSAFESVGLFKEQIDYFYSLTYILPEDEDSIRVSSDSGSVIRSHLHILKLGVINLDHILKTILPQENDEAVNIKLPKCHSLKELEGFFNDLDKGLYVFQYLGKEANVKGFDVGSEWVVVTLGLGTLIYKIVDKATILRNRWLEGSLHKATFKKIEAETAKIKAETTNKSLETLKEALNLIEQSESRELNKLKDECIVELLQSIKMEISNDYNEPELKNNIGLSLEYIGNLIDQGMEIHPEYSAPKEVQELANDVNKNIASYKKKLLGIPETKLITEDKGKKAEDESVKGDLSGEQEKDND